MSFDDIARIRYFRLDPRTHEVEPILDTPEAPAVLAWAQWFEENPDKHIADSGMGRVRVSTIFDGLDRSLGLPGEPRKLFETMVFIKGEPEDCLRSATYDEALDVHRECVEKYIRGMK